MDLSDFRASSDLQRDGVTIPFGSYSTITIRSSSNQKFVSYWNKIKKKHNKEIKAEKLSDETGRALLARAISQRMILGWEFLVIPKQMYIRDFKEHVDKQGNPSAIDLENKPAKHKDFDVPMVEIPYSKLNVFTVLNHGNYDSFRTWVMDQAGEISNFQEADFEDDLGN